MLNFCRLTLIYFSVIFSTFTLAMESQPQIIPYSQLKIGDFLGHGSQESVNKGTWEGTEVVIKKLYLGNMPQEFKVEAELIAQCKHPNIARFYGATMEENCNTLIIEYMPKGSLHDKIKDTSQELSCDQRLKIAIEIAEALKYLHENDIILGNLNSSKVLFSKDDVAKLSDAGFFRTKKNLFSTNSAEKTSNSFRWRAPETFKPRYEPNKPGDIYAFGMILWELISRKLPFVDAPDAGTAISWLREGRKETIPDGYPKEYGNLI